MRGQSFLSELHHGAVLVADGATGTNLQRRGLPAGTPPDEWVFDNPEAVMQLHKDFIKAGANIILTDTFGASNLRLRGSKFEGRATELNRRAVELARAAASDMPLFIAGSMGPVGGLLVPYGVLSQAEVFAAYAEQASALSVAGVDFLLIETQFSLEEAQAAVDGAKSISDLVLVVSFSFDQGTRTMMGVKPTQVVTSYKESGLAALGANCGKSLETMELVIKEMAEANPGIPIWAKPNAGMPVPGTAPAQYDTSPDQMAEVAVRLVQVGAQIVGGCCGSTPEHVAAIARAVKQDKSEN